MYISTVALSSKGQIVLPKAVRDLFRTTMVSLEINDGKQLVISPIRNVGSSLSDYKKNSPLPFEEARVLAWERSVAKRYKKKVA
jgi:AbrB family looped-hinge helix DNA binding protein